MSSQPPWRAAETSGSSTDAPSSSALSSRRRDQAVMTDNAGTRRRCEHRQVRPLLVRGGTTVIEVHLRCKEVDTRLCNHCNLFFCSEHSKECPHGYICHTHTQHHLRLHVPEDATGLEIHRRPSMEKAAQASIAAHRYHAI